MERHAPIIIIIIIMIPTESVDFTAVAVHLLINHRLSVRVSEQTRQHGKRKESVSL